MTYVAIWAGNGTHTGSILGYCAQCGLYHGSPAARSACVAFVAATDPISELAAWRLLKGAVVLEQAPYPITPAQVEPRIAVA